jgi:ABC-type transporter Mla subunit MlaD
MPNGPSRLRDTLLVAALLAVAAAALYLGSAIHQAAKVLGPLTEEVVHVGEDLDATSTRLQPAVDALPEALENLAAIREQVPDLLRELEGYRALAPEALAEVAAIRDEVPRILAAVAQAQQRIDALRSDLPHILDLSAQAIDVVRTTDATVQQGLTLVPEVLAESQAIRKSLPGTLDRLDGIVDGASKASKSAGRGIWRGLVRGVLSTPIDLLRDAEEGLLSRFVYSGNASHADFEYINETAAAVLADEKHEEKRWVNPQNGNAGRIRILREFDRDGVRCCRLDVTLEPKDGEPENFGKDVCLDSKGQWELLDSGA